MWRIWYEKNVPLRELETWTYDEIMKVSAILDMYSAVDTAREAYDKAELERSRREMEAKAGRH
jgi:hypothetical protein